MIVIVKQCRVCESHLTLDKLVYGKKSSFSKDALCRECKKTQQKKYREENREKIREQQKKYQEENKDRIKEHTKKNRNKINAWRKQYFKNNSNARIAHNLRCRMNKVLKGIRKSDSTVKLIDCSIENLIHYIAAQFSDGMSWDNYGKWHIDHIKPCSSFDLTDENQQKECFHYTNLQPLWAKDNHQKYNKIV